MGTTPPRISKTGYIIVHILLLVIYTIINLHHIQLLEIFEGAPCSKDFKRFWAIGSLFAQGENPYDIQILTEFIATHSDGQLKLLPNYYPPTTFTGLLIYSFFSFEVSRALFLLFTCLFYSYFWIVPMLRSTRGLSPTSLLPSLTFFIFFSFYPYLYFWWNGAVTIFPFVGLFAFFVFEKKHSSLAEVFQGLSLALTFIKPTICYLVVLYTIVVWIKNRAWKKLFGTIGGVIIITLPLFILVPSLSDFFTEYQKLPNPLRWLTPTISSFIQTQFAFPTYYRWFFVAVASGYVIWRAIRYGSNESLKVDICTLMIPLSLITVPYAWTYDFILLIFTINFILAQSRQGSSQERGSALIPAIIILLGNTLFFFQSFELANHWWYPLLLLLVALPLRINRKTEQTLSI